MRVFKQRCCKQDKKGGHKPSFFLCLFCGVSEIVCQPIRAGRLSFLILGNVHGFIKCVDKLQKMFKKLLF